MAWPAIISCSTRILSTKFVIHSSGHVSYIQAAVPSCGQDSRGWTSPRNALRYLHDRDRHCQTTVTDGSVRTTRSSKNMHIYKPDVALCLFELNSATASSIPARWICSEKKNYFLLVVTPDRRCSLQVENYSLLGDDAVLIDSLLRTFRRCLMPPSSRQAKSWIQVVQFTATTNCFFFFYEGLSLETLWRNFFSVKVKGKVVPITGHEGPEGE